MRAQAYFRSLHAVPNAPAVDIYFNGQKVAKSLSYQGFTPYAPITPGNYQVRIFLSGQMKNPLLDTTLRIIPKTIFTFAVIGLAPRIELLPIEDPKENLPPGKLGLRFVHLSPNTPRLDMLLATGPTLFENVGYKETAGYIPLSPGKYAIKLVPTGRTQSLLYVPNIRLTSGRFYTIYLVGLLGNRPPLQVLIPLDGNSYLHFS